MKRKIEKDIQKRYSIVQEYLTKEVLKNAEAEESLDVILIQK